MVNVSNLQNCSLEGCGALGLPTVLVSWSEGRCDALVIRDTVLEFI